MISTPTAEPSPRSGGNVGMGSQYLEIRDLVVDFDGFRAIDGVDLTLFQGDLRFLIGPNGAGKTTLIDAITGLVPVTGAIVKSGTQLAGMKPHRIVREGVVRTFQTPSVFENLSVLENLDIAAGARRGVFERLRARTAIPPAVDDALESTGLTAVADSLAGTLAHGQKKWLEIGMLLVQEANVLLLDEPVAGMNHDERLETGELLRRLGGSRTVLVVEHDMEFMRSFATSVTVMAAGRVLSEGSVSDVQKDPRVQAVYLGTTNASEG